MSVRKDKGAGLSKGEEAAKARAKSPTPQEGIDLEAHAQREDQAMNLWDDGLRDIREIAGKVSMSVPEVRRVLADRRRMTWEGDDVSLRIAEVSAKDLHDTLLFRAEILSMEGPLSLPSRVRGECMRCTEGKPEEIDVDPWEFLFLTPAERKAYLELKGLQAASKIGCKHSGSRTKVRSSEARAVDYWVLTVADVPEETRFAESFEDIRLKLHLIGTRPPLGGSARFRGTVESDPRTGELLIISEEFQELESRPAAPKLDDWMKRQLREIGRMPLDKLRGQIAPDMVGRPLVQEARLLVLMSPIRIRDVDNREIRGSLIEVLLGDTKTDKSESAGDTARAQGFGSFVQAENAARTGLTYSITELKTGGWALTWGILPRSHGKYIVLDGLEKWGEGLMIQLRGVLGDQEVQVDRVVHGRRPAAVRMTVTINPEKAVREYPFRCQAIVGAKAFVKGPDISRIDLWHVFANEDVSEEEIAHRAPVSRPVDDKIFRTLVHWAWSRKPEDVKWAPEATELVKDKATEMMKAYSCSTLPVVHSGFRDVLCRVSAACAALHFSTTNGEDLVVTKTHVEEAVAFLRRMYDAIQLHEYKEHAEKDVTLTGGEFLSTVIEIGEPGLHIIQHLTKGPQTSEELAEALGGQRTGYTAKVVRDRYDELRRHGLIETRSGLGAYLTAKGTGFFHFLLSLEGDFVPKSVQTRGVCPGIGANKSLRVLEEYENPPLQTAPPSSSPEAFPSPPSSTGELEDRRKEGPDEGKDEGGPPP